MTFRNLLKKAGIVMSVIALPAFFCNDAISQIVVFERSQSNDISSIGLFRSSPSRQKISLNGAWEVSFNSGENYQKFSVPLAYNFSGKAIFKRKFDIPSVYLNIYSFIFVAEGIDYESEVRINGNYVATHTGGMTPVISPVNDGIISTGNEIVISVSSELNYSNTLPLSNQVNYGTVDGGINKDIYLLAVPKLHVTSSKLKYIVDNVLSVDLTNLVSVRSSNLSSFMNAGSDSAFSVRTSVVRKSTGEEVAQSSNDRFEIGENNSLRIESKVRLTSPVLWTPDLPELYDVKTFIYSGTTIVDEFVQETGFTNFSFKSGQIFVNGKPTKLIGINYFEDQPRNSTALSYEDAEKDLRSIKTTGFNAVRVPGRCAHPYIVELCNKLGLFLLQEIPMNEEASSYLRDEKFVRLTLNTLTDIVDRDMNSPCIVAWGIGNDFDVSGNSAREYVSMAKAVIDSLDRRMTYYTSRTFNEDICSELVDFVGVNFYGKKYEEIRNSVIDITNRQRPPANRKNQNVFAARFGIRIENGNTNGFSDLHSQESQMKFLSETYPKIMQSTLGGFICSYADWHSSNILNFRLSHDPSLVTDGIHTYYREEKRSAGYVKRIIYNEDLPRIQEGNAEPDFPYAFIVIGILTMIILLYFLNRDKKLRSGLIRCLYKPTYFYSLVKDQMIISTGYNLIIALSISVGLALFFSSILYFLKASNSLDILLAKTFTNDHAKLFVSQIINNKFYLIGAIAFINLLLVFFTSFFLYFISFYTRGKSFYKNILTVCIWSTLPMLVFLPIGTVIFRLAQTNTAYITMALWLFFVLYVLYLNRIILGARSLFDIKTGKVYLYGIAIVVLFLGSIWLYTWLFTGIIETGELIRHLTAR